MSCLAGTLRIDRLQRLALEQHLQGNAKWTFLGGRGYHQIPYGTTLPKGVDNLLPGRCATTPEGQARCGLADLVLQWVRRSVPPLNWYVGAEDVPSRSTDKRCRFYWWPTAPLSAMHSYKNHIEEMREREMVNSATWNAKAMSGRSF